MSTNYQPTDKSDLLRVIRSEREKLDSNFEGLEDPQMVAPGVEVDWSLKDILAHIAAWERVAIDIVQSARDKVDLPAYIDKIFENVDAFNAQVYEKNLELSLTVIRSEFQTAHQDFLTLIESLDENFTFSKLPFEGATQFTIQYIISP